MWQQHKPSYWCTSPPTDTQQSWNLGVRSWKLPLVKGVQGLDFQCDIDRADCSFTEQCCHPEQPPSHLSFPKIHIFCMHLHGSKAFCICPFSSPAQSRSLLYLPDFSSFGEGKLENEDRRCVYLLLKSMCKRPKTTQGFSSLWRRAQSLLHHLMSHGFYWEVSSTRSQRLHSSVPMSSLHQEMIRTGTSGYGSKFSVSTQRGHALGVWMCIQEAQGCKGR